MSLFSLSRSARICAGLTLLLGGCGDGVWIPEEPLNDSPSDDAPPTVRPPGDPPAPNASLFAEPAVVRFRSPVGADTIAPQDITLRDASEESYPWAIEVVNGPRRRNCPHNQLDDPWLSISASSGDTLPVSLTIEPVEVLSEPAFCAATIKLFEVSGGARIEQASVSVKYVMEKQLVVDPTELSFSLAWLGSDPPTGPQTLTISDEHGGSYPWVISPVWYLYRPGCQRTDWLSFSPASEDDPWVVASGDSLPAEVTIEVNTPFANDTICEAQFQVFGGWDASRLGDVWDGEYNTLDVAVKANRFETH